MTNKDLANVIFPNITKTIDDYEKMYPERNLKEGACVTRFAPSPTGFMHLGGLFQAIINYVIAKESNGVFFLRNEDTDKTREIEGAVELIMHTLNSYNLTPDEYEFEGKKRKIAVKPLSNDMCLAVTVLDSEINGSLNSLIAIIVNAASALPPVASIGSRIKISRSSTFFGIL